MSSKIWIFLKRLAISPLVLCFLSILIFFLVLVTPLVIYRRLIFHLGPKIRPSLGKMLTVPSSIMAADQTSKLSTSTCVGELEINGIVDINEYRKALSERLLEARRENGELIAPEMKQFPIQWLGFYFWKSDENFDLTKHVEFWNPEECQSLEMSEIKKRILLEPFEKNKPLWKNYFIEKRSKDCKATLKTTIIVKFHHCIADGYSVMKVFFKPFEGSFKPPQRQISIKPKCETDSNCKKIAEKIAQVLLLPFDLFEYFIPQIIVWLFFSNYWISQIPSHKKIQRDYSDNFAYSETHGSISMEKLKNIAKINKVGVTSVIVSIFAGAIRRYFKEINEVKVPKAMYMSVATPLPHHPDNKLRNLAMITSLALKINIKDPIERLKKTHEEFIYAIQPSIQICAFYLGLYFISVPVPFLKLMRRCLYGVIASAYSGVPGAKIPFFWEGSQVDFISYSLPSFRFGIPLLLTSLTWNGCIKFAGSGLLTIFPNDESMTRLMTFIEEEIDQLDKLAVV